MNNFNLDVKIKAEGEYSYPIIIGENLLNNAEIYIKNYTKANKFLIVTNETIYDLYKNKINISNAEIIILPDGEEYKNFDSYQKILNKCFEMKLERKDCLIAFGGGVIGDLTGFVASTYLRGIDFIQIPTTLLAQVDSSVGGKVAINNEFGKNLIGAFYQPKLVLSDISTLKTLDLRQLKTGLAEVLKYGFIEKSCKCHEKYNFLNFLKENKAKIYNLDLEIIKQLIYICCSLKSCVVFNDEKEKGLRQILNFGHTYAHAIEKLTNYKILTHGEAVALGMEYIFNLSKNDLDIDYYNFSTDLINEYDLIPDIILNNTNEEIEKVMHYDKKSKDGNIIFIKPINYAEVYISQK